MCAHQRPLHVCSACVTLCTQYRYNIMTPRPHSTAPARCTSTAVTLFVAVWLPHIRYTRCVCVCVRLVTCCPFFVRVCSAAEECVVAVIITVVRCVYHTDLYNNNNLYYIQRVSVMTNL